MGLALVLSACTVAPTQPPAPVEKEPDYTEVQPPATDPRTAPRPENPSISAAYKPLLAQADQAAARGDYEQALALLERAQRIDPDSAEIYLEMAKTHRTRGDLGQARATAERGLLYCSGDAQCAALRELAR